MTTYIKRRGSDGRWVWQTRARKQGWPQQTRTFDLKSEAQTWARTIESEMARGAWCPSAEAEATTLAEALERYASEVSARKRGAHQEGGRMATVSPPTRPPIARRYPR